ncbi:MAG: hypothetical protein C4291_00675 [Candidatus Dadabacteria bacterium]
MASLRFAIICNGMTFPRWQAECLKKILELGNVHIALLILNYDNVVSRNPFIGVFTRLRRLNFREILFQFYSSLIAQSSPFRPVNMMNLLSRVPSIHCKVVNDIGDSAYFSNEYISRIRQFDLDFILNFGFNVLCGDILNSARYGVWSFHHSDEVKYGGILDCFWETYSDDHHVIGVVLKRLTGCLDGGVILRKGFFPNISYSFTANLRMIFLETSCWPMQVCIDILNGNIEYLNAPPSPMTVITYRTPSNSQMVLFLLKLLRGFFIKKFNRFFYHEEWNIGIIKEPISALLKTEVRPAIQWLPKPEKDHYLADPFAIAKDHKFYIFCEDFDCNSGKGVISNIELSNNSYSIVKKEIVLSTSFHLSYPFLFEYKGEFYCIPETSDACEIAIYRAEHFPSRWIKVCTLIKDFPGIDSTIFKYGSYWWLFCTNAKDGMMYKLFIWYAPNLTGPWEPHKLNPVKIDVRSVRPAGTPFMHDSCLYRPAQDCSVTYGGRVVLNRIVRLTPVAFEEEPIVSIEPDRNSHYRDGLHTISAAGDVTLVDGKRRVFSFRAFIYTVRYMLKDFLWDRRGNGSLRFLKYGRYTGWAKVLFAVLSICVAMTSFHSIPLTSLQRI